MGCLVSSCCLTQLQGFVYSTLQGEYVAEAVAQLTQCENINSGIQFVPMFSVFWALVALALSFVAYVCIPLVLQRRPTVINDQLLERSSSLIKYLWGSVIVLSILISSLVVAEQNPSTQVGGGTLTKHIFMISTNLLLAWRIRDRATGIAVEQYLWNLFNIKANTSNVPWHPGGNK